MIIGYGKRMLICWLTSIVSSHFPWQTSFVIVMNKETIYVRPYGNASSSSVRRESLPQSLPLFNNPAYGIISYLGEAWASTGLEWLRSDDAACWNERYQQGLPCQWNNGYNLVGTSAWFYPVNQFLEYYELCSLFAFSSPEKYAKLNATACVLYYYILVRMMRISLACSDSLSHLVTINNYWYVALHVSFFLDNKSCVLCSAFPA
jgi:hypothetical protein